VAKAAAEEKAKAEAAIIMSKIDFNHNKDIDYSCN
jgi:hypothetical protein